MSSDPDIAFDWPTRWERLAHRVALAGDEPLLIALSGGADSVLLLHLATRSEARPPVHAVHVDHGLRGPESAADARFCAELCSELGVPFTLKRADLDRGAPDLEARARRARYDALAEEARRLGLRAIATGHHADDSLETLILRWLRGTELAGLGGIEARAHWGTGPDALLIVRPLIDLRRAEVRAILEGAGLGWREDSSNQDPRFTRNRIRHALLPQLSELCGPWALESLHRFGRAVAELEDQLAARTAHISWRPAARAAAGRSRAREHLGGSLPRAELMALVPPLRRRVLWRLLTEATGRAPSRAWLDNLLSDLARGRTTRGTLPGAWTLQLRSDRLHLSPPAPHLPLHSAVGAREHQLALPFAAGAENDEQALRLRLPGWVSLPDGRAISAELATPAPGSDVPRSAVEVELDAESLRGPLRVRWPLPGDRFHGLGAPGSRPLARFLADAGVPSAERGRVPLVFDGQELVWVAGIRPAERPRVRRTTARRLRLVLHGAAREPRREQRASLFRVGAAVE